MRRILSRGGIARLGDIAEEHQDVRIVARPARQADFVAFSAVIVMTALPAGVKKGRNSDMT